MTASAALLGISIWRTRHQPLLKGSVVAYLFHGSEGWTDRELSALLPAEESMESLEEVSKGMVVSLLKDDNGRWRLRKVEENLKDRTQVGISINF